MSCVEGLVAEIFEQHQALRELRVGIAVDVRRAQAFAS